jgi:hypothetical protein
MTVPRSPATGQDPYGGRALGIAAVTLPRLTTVTG